MRLKVVLGCVILSFLASCGSKKTVVNTKNPDVVIVEPKPVDLPSVDEEKIVKKLEKNKNLNKTTLDYIEKYAAIAVNEMHKYKIPASITLAQGVLESGSGRSELASKSNNHFGIKCHTTWKGDRVYHDDDEKGECFRKYVYVETSYNDHSLFLTQRKRYAFLFDYDIKDYEKWAYGLRKAGYATDKKYPEKLLRIIEDYELHRFDLIEEKQFVKEIQELNDGDLPQEPEIITKPENFHTVEKGETLYSISKKYNVSMEKLKEMNNLKDNIIRKGQRLKVKE